MSLFDFVYLEKQSLDRYLPDLFAILHSNMSLIAPTNNSYSEDYVIWCSFIVPAMQEKGRQIALLFVENKLNGYFQYYVNTDKKSLMLEEIQIKKEKQGIGLFSKFCNWLVEQLPRDILYVEAYANKKNIKSQNILEHLGLVASGENKNGNSVYYKGKYTDMLDRYSCNQ